MARAGAKLRTIAAFITATGACSFQVTGSISSVDAPPTDTQDAGVGEYWLHVAVTRGDGPAVEIHPFDGIQLSSSCAARARPTFAVRDFEPNPSAPVMYAIEGSFHAAATSCENLRFTQSISLGSARAIQQIAFAATTQVGFFTADGPGATGVYRFTSGPDGTPTLAGTANATSNSGPLALDVERRLLFTASTYGLVDAYALSAALELPATRSQALGCTEPVALVTATDAIYEVCANDVQLRRYTPSPFAYEGDAGAIGPISAAVASEGGAILARSTPPRLLVLDLVAPTPTWTDGPELGSAAVALAASPDGRVLAAARVVGASQSEVTLWSVREQSLTLLTSATLEGEITALALTAPQQ